MQKQAGNDKKYKACRDHELAGYSRVYPGVENHDQSCDYSGSKISVRETSGTHFSQKIGIPEGFDDGMRTCDQEKTSKKQKHQFFFARLDTDDTG